MLVVHVISGLGKGGAEATLYRLLCSMKDAKIQHVVISLIPGEYYARKIEDLGVPLYDLGFRRGIPMPTGLLRLRRLLNRLAPDVIHAWMYHAAFLCLLMRAKAPVLVGIHHALHAIETESQLTAFTIRWLAGMTARARGVVYCARASRLQHEEIGYSKARASVIPNGFDCTTLRPMPTVREQYRGILGLDRDVFVVGHIGRNHETKDHDNLLEGFARQIRVGPAGLRLVMAGPGVTGLADRVARLGLQQSVILLDERDDVPNLLNCFDILVNASRSESFPNVLGEAMACGTPCIATDVGDSALIVGDTGIIVPPRNPEALAAAIAALIAMSQQERGILSQAARQRIIERFSLVAMADSYEALYRELTVQTTSTFAE